MRSNGKEKEILRKEKKTSSIDQSGPLDGFIQGHCLPLLIYNALLTVYSTIVVLAPLPVSLYDFLKPLRPPFPLNPHSRQWDFIHSTVRNRLSPERANILQYCYINLRAIDVALHGRKRKSKKRKYTVFAEVSSRRN